ncbi:MAG: YbgC/FadM family acyl-CoA thioesterase [Sulfuricurvum sp.]|uniref:YbgC/FadM family acyl-CoA thioesterase n=1 Tax=Sulfuricurvum sp. TaxID=2025608 RepID=UPI00263129B8|nr:YbgC/FadM family acyl-CoA thioesterase [Sulfuricurvum sp.]MDD5161081.1 YbgC/FadM family acyl-CoA thioesterase [Sulfuricurvum sp.]
MKIRVYYEDTDVGGVVYHSNYLKFCDRARNQLFFDADRSLIFEEGILVVKHIDADYLKTAKFGDILEVNTTLLEIKNASFCLLQKIFRGDEKIFEMKIDIVFIDFGGNIAKIPLQEKAFLSGLS